MCYYTTKEKSMITRKLTKDDVKGFQKLILDMYANLVTLEWFSPMPLDEDFVLSMIEDERFYILGLFDEKELVGVTSLDFKCGKIFGKVEFPEGCEEDKLVEIAFNIVRSDYRGHGYMKMLVEEVIEYAKSLGLTDIFSKVHQDNFASSKSIEKNGLVKFTSYAKPLKVKDIKFLLEKNVLSKSATDRAYELIEACDGEIIDCSYNLFYKKF